MKIAVLLLSNYIYTFLVSEVFLLTSKSFYFLVALLAPLPLDVQLLFSTFTVLKKINLPAVIQDLSSGWFRFNITEFQLNTKLALAGFFCTFEAKVICVLHIFSKINLKNRAKLCCCFFFYLVFFHGHSQIIGLQGKGEGISLTPLYHFYPLHRHRESSIWVSQTLSSILFVLLFFVNNVLLIWLHALTK